MVFRRAPQGSSRTRRTFAALLATALAALLLAAGAEARLPANFFGVSPVTTLNQSQMDIAKAGGVSTLRAVFQWNAIEPADGQFDWERTDGLVKAAAESGVDLTPVLFQTPSWASGCSGDSGCLYVPPVGTQALEQGWSGFLKALVGRYGPGGTFWTDPLNLLIPKRPIRTWIPWNEENGKTYFPPKASPKRYASLLKKSAAAIHSVDPGAQIVLGGLAGGGNVDHNAGSLPADKFLAKLYKQNGARNSFDVVALHPYSPNIKDFEKEVTKDRAAIKKAHDGATPLWLTEVGWGSNKSSSYLSKGLHGQAKLLKKSFALVERKQRTWNVKKLFWFTWHDVANTPCPWCGAAGLFTQDMKPKPAWTAYKKFAKP